MTTANNHVPQQRPKRVSSLIGGLALGLLIAGMGLFFVYALILGYGRATETRDWSEVPMEITKSEIEEEQIGSSPAEYRAIIEYRYTFAGKEYTGQGIRRVEGRTKHKSKAQRTIDKWPIGKQGSCFVNPQQPTQTVLKHNTKAVLYTVWFPGLFVVAGLGIAIGSIRGYIKK